MEHQRLRELRDKQNMTQAQVASYLKVDRTTYVKYEKGQSNPDDDTKVKLAQLFGVTTDYLLGNDDTPQNNVTDSDEVELAEYLETLRTRPETRMLFSLTKGATKEDVEKAVAIIEALSKHE